LLSCQEFAQSTPFVIALQYSVSYFQKQVISMSNYKPGYNAKVHRLSWVRTYRYCLRL